MKIATVIICLGLVIQTTIASKSTLLNNKDRKTPTKIIKHDELFKQAQVESTSFLQTMAKTSGHAHECCNKNNLFSALQSDRRS